MTDRPAIDFAAVQARLAQFEILKARMRPDPPGYDFGPTAPEIRFAFAALLTDAQALFAAADVTDAERAAMAIVRGARVDPLLLRWCEWPGCWASFDATTGPAEPGWILASHKALLLCPRDAAAGHVPDWTYDRTLRVVTAECSCGLAEDVTPGNQDTVTLWWRGHVTSLAAEAT